MTKDWSSTAFGCDSWDGYFPVKYAQQVWSTDTNRDLSIHKLSSTVRSLHRAEAQTECSANPLCPIESSLSFVDSLTDWSFFLTFLEGQSSLKNVLRAITTANCWKPLVNKNNSSTGHSVNETYHNTQFKPHLFCS